MKTIEMYEKPQALFVDMQSTHALADTCWGSHGKGVIYTYECVHPEHAGVTVMFKIKKGGCKFTSESVDLMGGSVPDKIAEEFWNMGNSQPVKTCRFIRIVIRAKTYITV